MEFELRVFSEARGVESLRWQADSQDAVLVEARARGLTVLSSRPLGGLTLLGPGPARMRFPLLLFSRELLALLGAGLPLLEALETLGEKEPQDAVRKVLAGLARHIAEGMSLSRALAEHPQAFPPLYVAGIRASEQSGAVPDALRRYIVYQEQIDAVRRKLASAMIYPTLLLVAGGLVVIFLMGYVVPRFSRIYADRAMDLPWLSRLLLDWGRLIDANGPTVLALLCALAAGIWLATAHTHLAARFAALGSRLPGVGEHFRLYQLTRLYRTMAMLLRGGLPISAALSLVPGLLAPDLRERLELAAEAIREGRSLSLALGEHGLATGVAARLLRVGERSGQMHEMLDHIANFHEDEIARRLDMFTRTIEPALMMGIGLAIGAIVVLMYLPIFELAGSFRP